MDEYSIKIRCETWRIVKENLTSVEEVRRTEMKGDDNTRRRERGGIIVEEENPQIH